MLRQVSRLPQYAPSDRVLPPKRISPLVAHLLTQQKSILHLRGEQRVPALPLDGGENTQQQYNRKEVSMALFRFSSSLDPINALMNLQRELDRALENPLGFNFGLSGRGVFPPRPCRQFHH